MEQRQAKKEQNVAKLENTYTKLTATIRKDLDAEDMALRQTALVIALMLETGERLGNETSQQNGHLGISTLMRENVAIKNGIVTLVYVAKSGRRQVKMIKNPVWLSKIAHILRGCKKGELIFKATNRKRVNDYLSAFGFTSKSIRTHIINQRIQKAADKSKGCGMVIKETAHFIGHTPSTLKRHYLLLKTKKACKL